MKKYILYFCATLIIFSCSSESSSDIDLELDQDTVLIKRKVFTRTNGEVRTADFYYETGSNRLNSVKGSQGYEFRYEYSADLLTEVDVYESGTKIIDVNIEYDAGILDNYTAYFLNGTAERFEFNFISPTSISVKRYSGDYSSQIFQEDVEVQLIDGNVKSVNFTNYSVHYTYDDHNCTYKNVFAIDILNYIGLDYGGFEGIYNNPLDRIEIDNGEVETEAFAHTYNDIDFPQSTEVYKNGELEGTITYYYE